MRRSARGRVPRAAPARAPDARAARRRARATLRCVRAQGRAGGRRPSTSANRSAPRPDPAEVAAVQALSSSSSIPAAAGRLRVSRGGLREICEPAQVRLTKIEPARRRDPESERRRPARRPRLSGRASIRAAARSRRRSSPSPAHAIQSLPDHPVCRSAAGAQYFVSLPTATLLHRQMAVATVPRHRIRRGPRRRVTRARIVPEIRVPASGTSMSEERLIKKYANRRLYDASQSRHITLDDIRHGRRRRARESRRRQDERRHHATDPAAGHRGSGTIRATDPVDPAARIVDPVLRQFAAGLPQRLSGKERRDLHAPAGGRCRRSSRA